MDVLYHFHASAWLLTVIFFLLSVLFLKSNRPTIYKVSHMILRLLFVVMVISGIGLLIMYQFPLVYVVKGILALLLIGLMEMILARAKKGVPSKALWAQFLVVLPLVVLLGFDVIHF